MQWFMAVDAERRGAICRDYHCFKEAQVAWLENNPRLKRCFQKQPVRRQHVASTVAYALAVGSQFLDWEKTPAGQATKAKHVDFSRQCMGFVGRVPKKHKVFLARCIRAAAASRSDGGRGPPITAQSSAKDRRPDRYLQRRRMSQGPPFKCPIVREYLWDWFVDIRRSIAGRISPKFVLKKAEQIATEVLKEMHRSGHYVELQMINKPWLRRWKRDYGVCYRKPNQRYKCSRQVLGNRLRTMWLNCIRVRRAAQRLLGHDLQYAIYGIDETPFHMNESGSKSVGTLEIQGAPAVRLKENHAATRQRVSVMTTVTSCRAAALQPRQLPIEVCVAGTSRKLRGVAIPKGVNMTIIASPKGSYRTEHMLQFLDRWLDPWTEDRAKRRGWRLLFLVVAARSHL